MLFHLATGYALQAIADLPEGDDYVMTRDLAERLSLPAPFLSKILQNLARAGILESSRGAKGGFRLGRPAERITVQEVLVALEGEGSLDRCVMGFPTCDPEQPCPLHDAWSTVKTQMLDSLATTSVADLRRAALAKLEKGKGAVGPIRR
ncbi:MAG TPA: Rrf2 family transcriptional regulator [Holophagaceae bacterium]|nr:Rrf2 family transcriptional regulator [Holophagaceae bacterium]